MRLEAGQATPPSCPRQLYYPREKTFQLLFPQRLEGSEFLVDAFCSICDQYVPNVSDMVDQAQRGLVQKTYGASTHQPGYLCIEKFGNLVAIHHGCTFVFIKSCNIPH